MKKINFSERLNICLLVLMVSSFGLIIWLGCVTFEHPMSSVEINKIEAEVSK